jgi:hypothetical protein
MKNYIVYDKSTKIIKNTFEYFCTDMFNMLKNNTNLKWLNITHSKTKNIYKQLKYDN